MKKVLFISNGMDCGGVERALISVLSVLDPQEIDVTLMLARMSGPFLPQVPKWVKVVEMPMREVYRRERTIGRRKLFVELACRANVWEIGRILYRLVHWRLLEHELPYDYTVLKRELKMMTVSSAERYDWVLAYGSGWTTPTIALSLFPQCKKAMWFHDSTQPETEGMRLYRDVYSKFDRRFAVARKLAAKLTCDYGCKAGEIDTMPHFVDAESYRKAAGDVGFTDDYSGVRILTVGRLEWVKGLDLAAEAAKMLKECGCKFRWYVIGDGVRQRDLEQQIQALDVSDCFVLLGRRNNPYPFFKECDVYVQPSRFESYCLTLAEARVFNKSIVCTDFIGADEQIKNGETGIIVESITGEAIFKGVKALLDDEALRRQFSGNLAKVSADTVKEAKAKWSALISCG